MIYVCYISLMSHVHLAFRGNELLIPSTGTIQGAFTYIMILLQSWIVVLVPFHFRNEETESHIILNMFLNSLSQEMAEPGF